MNKVTTLLLLVSMSLFADKVITKTTFINQANYADKNMEQMKAILLNKVKIDAATRMYKKFEFLTS